MKAPDNGPWSAVPIGLAKVAEPRRLHLGQVARFRFRRRGACHRPLAARFDLPSVAAITASFLDDPERCESFVPVRWLQTVALEKAMQEIGLFGNQNTVCNGCMCVQSAGRG
jgi:hypothetical protein